MPLGRFMTAEMLSKHLVEEHGVPVSPTRLEELAITGHLPHYYVEDGPPFFDPEEVKERLAIYFVKRHKGHPRPWELAVFDPGEMVAQRRPVPQSLSMLHDRLWDIPLAPFRWPPGIYFLMAGVEIAYIGKTTALLQRLLTHFREKSFDRILFLPVPGEELSQVETEFIRRFRPPLNSCESLAEELPPWRTDLETLLNLGKDPS